MSFHKQKSKPLHPISELNHFKRMKENKVRRIHTEIDDLSFVNQKNKKGLLDRHDNIEAKVKPKMIRKNCQYPKEKSRVGIITEGNDRSRKEQKSKKVWIKDYQVEQIIGQGTFGTVFKAKGLKGEKVAIKKVLQDKKYKNRQLAILKQLNNSNVLQLKQAFYTQNKGQTYLNVVMQYFPHTLYSLNRRYTKNKANFPSTLIKLYAYQLFKGLSYIQSGSICHRDIKPQNILVDPISNRLVICDFGSAKKLVKTQTNVSYICSRCYRAPELIFGATNYSTQIDMWSSACVICQLITGTPLFFGDSNIAQMIQIMKVIGSPSSQQILQMNPDYNLNDQKNLPKIKGKQLKKIIKCKIDPFLLDLLQKIFKYDPIKRLNPLQALTHPYFSELRDKGRFIELSRKTSIPNLFDFNLRQFQNKKQFSKKLIPQWSKQLL